MRSSSECHLKYREDSITNKNNDCLCTSRCSVLIASSVTEIDTQEGICYTGHVFPMLEDNNTKIISFNQKKSFRETHHACGRQSVTPSRFSHMEMNIAADISQIWNNVHFKFLTSVVLRRDFHNQNIFSCPVCIDPLLYFQQLCCKPFVKYSLANVKCVQVFPCDSPDSEINRCCRRHPCSVSVLIQIHRINWVFLGMRWTIENSRYIHGITVDHCANKTIANGGHKIAISARNHRASTVVPRQLFGDKASRRS